MREELVKKLQQEFKWIPAKSPLYREDLNINFFVDTDDGWFNIIYKLCKDIDAVIKEENVELTLLQVKEKLGGLRFYIGGGNDKIYSLIRKAEAESYRTCECCGGKGKLRVNENGWYKTLCDDCTQRPYGIFNQVRKWVVIER